MKELNGIIRFENPKEFIQYFDAKYGISYYNKASSNRGEFLDKNEYDEILRTTRANEPILLYKEDTDADSRSMGFCYNFRHYKTEEAIKDAETMLEKAKMFLEFYKGKDA